MGLKSLAKPKKTLLAIDASTNSFAFALFEGKSLVKYGEITFAGKGIFDRLSDAQQKVFGMRDELKADEIVIEGATYVQNKRTVILLAYCFGAIISALARPGVEVREVPPITWQNAIGNKALNKVEKAVLKKANPDKSDNWLKNEAREIRKKRTMDWVAKTFNVVVSSDNITDAIALGAVAVRD